MNNIKVLAQSVEVIKVEPQFGASIEKVFEEAVALAGGNRTIVSFDFNGRELIAKAGDDAADLARQYREGVRSRANAWRESPDGKLAEAAAAARHATNSVVVAALLAKLDDVIDDEPALVAWVGKFAEVADGTILDADSIADRLESAGYLRNGCAGHPSIRVDKEIYARWLVGQVIDNLRRGFGPNSVVMKFAADYSTMWPDK